MQPSHVSPRPRENRTATRRVERALFEEVLPYVLRSLSRLGVPISDRDELAQEVMTAAYEGLHKYDPSVSSPRRWCWGYAKNMARNYLRKSEAGLGPLDEHVPDIIDESPGAEERYMVELHSRLLHEVLLPQVEFNARVVLIAHYLDELDCTTIATQENIPISTVYARRDRGFKELQAAYDRHQRRQKARGLLVLPFALEHLLAADRTIPSLPPELVDRMWNQVQRALARRTHLQAPRALPQHPALVLVPTFLGGAVVGALLLSFFQSPPQPTVVVQPDPVKSVAVDVLGTSAPHVPPPAVTAVTTPPKSSASRRDFRNAQRDFEFAYQAVVSGKYDAALKALAIHERDFPAGPFAAQRKTLRARIAELQDAGDPAQKVNSLATNEP
jgi:RNA polymerase sigma factor (sigma-70 family)